MRMGCDLPSQHPEADAAVSPTCWNTLLHRVPGTVVHIVVLGPGDHPPGALTYLPLNQPLVFQPVASGLRNGGKGFKAASTAEEPEHVEAGCTNHEGEVFTGEVFARHTGNKRWTCTPSRPEGGSVGVKVHPASDGAINIIPEGRINDWESTETT